MWGTWDACKRHVWRKHWAWDAHTTLVSQLSRNQGLLTQARQDEPTFSGTLELSDNPSCWELLVRQNKDVVTAAGPAPRQVGGDTVHDLWRRSPQIRERQRRLFAESRRRRSAGGCHRRTEYGAGHARGADDKGTSRSWQPHARSSWLSLLMIHGDVDPVEPPYPISSCSALTFR
jgi:hypothetical protein